MIEKRKLFDGNYLIVKNSSQSSLWPSARLSHPGCDCADNFFGGGTSLHSPPPPWILAPLLAESHRAGGDCVGHHCLPLWSYNSSLTHTEGEKALDYPPPFQILCSLSYK